jgi:hypothetical protein
MTKILALLLASILPLCAQTITMSGDVTGTNTATTVVKVNGTTIPSASSTALGLTPNAAGAFAQLDSNDLFSRLGLNTTGITNAGISGDVWIAVRTDGNAGSGIKDDPFDGSTYTKFDALMNTWGAIANTNIHLLPGVFPTSGLGGWTITGNYVKVLGSGRGATTIRMVAYNSAGGGSKAVVTGTGIGDEIHDLTVDGNYATVSALPGWTAHTAI